MSPSEGSAPKQTEGNSSVILNLDPTIYSRDALLRASYWFTDRAYIRFLEPSENRLCLQIEVKHPQPTLENPRPTKIDELSREFLNSALDFELRRQIEKETSSVRQIILAKAFSESGLLEDTPPGTVADPVEHTKQRLISIRTKNI
jgi:His-Xaa-Ser system protein HxsD